MLRASDESPRMFDNEALDLLSRTPWWTVPLLWIPGSAAFFTIGLSQGAPPLLSALAFVAGVLLWTLTEYSLHRSVFHWIPAAPWGDRFHFFVHGVHHQWHWDRFRLVMPPAVSLLLCVVFGLAFRLVLGPVWMWPSFAGFVLGYCVYDCAHYAVHHLKWQARWFQRLRAHHMSHHHNPKYHSLRFGVSTMLWDRVFGTMEPPKSAPGKG